MRCPRVPDASRPGSCALTLQRESEGGGGRGWRGGASAPPRERRRGLPGAALWWGEGCSTGRSSSFGGGVNSRAPVVKLFNTFSNSYSFKIVAFFLGPVFRRCGKSPKGKNIKEAQKPIASHCPLHGAPGVEAE